MIEEQSITPYSGVQQSPATAREVFAILFRHRRLVVISFLAVFAGVIIGVLVFGIRYRATTKILVKHQRDDTVISGDVNQQMKAGDDLARQREINTEVELLSSSDLLEKVAKASGLDKPQSDFWSRWLPTWGGPDYQTAKAVHKLKKKLDVQNVPDSNMIEVTYTAHDPELAARVLQNLDTFYIAKHVTVYSPPNITSFFDQQAQHYQQELANAEDSLASYDLQQNAPEPQLQRNILVNKASDFDDQLKQTRADIARTRQWIETLQAESAKIPERIPANETRADNPQLLANLKSTLQNLEIQRTGLLENFQPSYRPIQELDKQIANVKANIAAQQDKPLIQNSTDRNPTYDMAQTELAKARAELTALNARAAAMAPMVQAYSKQAVLLDQKQLKQQDLLRNIKTSEQNYLLYLQKSEQARISDALDSRRILNVTVAESAGIPALPVNSPWVLILAGGILALMVSMGSAFAADYFDPSFRTPDEVVKYLEIPVLAALPKNGHAPRFALEGPADSIAPGAENGKTGVSLLWKRGNGD